MQALNSPQTRTILVEEVIGGYTVQTEMTYVAPLSVQESYVEKAQSNIDELKEFLRMCDQAMDELKVLKKLV